jgi:putative transposase
MMANNPNSDYWDYLAGVAKEDSYRACDLPQNDIIHCKFCGASKLVKYGYSKGVQCWKCKTCYRKFVDNKAAPGMKTPKEQIGYVLSMYYEGMGFKFILQNLWQKYNCHPSESTFYEWIERFTQKAIADSKKDKPRVGKVWIVLASPVSIGGELVWFWDIFDIKTRFFLASHISKQLTLNDVRMTLAQAVKRVGHLPEVIFIDGPVARIENLRLECNGNYCSIIQKHLVNPSGARILKQFRADLNARSVIMKRFKHLNSVKRINHGWQVHYNYLRPYEILHKCTPAYQANIHTSRLSREVNQYYVNDFWFLWSDTMSLSNAPS